MRPWQSPGLWCPADAVNQPCAGTVSGRVKVLNALPAVPSLRLAHGKSCLSLEFSSLCWC